MKYIELGFGNRWALRTEIESADGAEFEHKGVIRPIKFHSAYLRIWIGKRVCILDLREGVKLSKKSRNNIKFLLGIVSY